MQLSKCKYFNDHQTACCLMIDDLVPAAVSLDGKLGPYNDWGYLMNGPDSLFAFFKQNLLEKYPEIRGTFFLPLESQYCISEETEYTVFRRDIDEKFVEFTTNFANAFELAFHGIKHTYKKDDQWVFEFENPGAEDVESFEKKLALYTDKGIIFTGGKFPGYRYNEKAIDFVQLAGFKWLALNVGMINRKHPENELNYVENTSMVKIPSNLSGDIFKENSNRAGFLKRAIKHLLYPGSHFKPEKYLEYLYSHGHTITIQEHFQNQRTDGKRQRPNVYDDIRSLDRIFSFLRSMDIWYATCSEIAHYFDSYTNTAIIEKNNNEFEIRYQGNWDKMLLSFAAECSSLEEAHGGNKISGIPQNGMFVFNSLKAGIYRSCQ